MAEGSGSGEAAAMQVSVVSPERILFEGPASALVVPAWDGLLGILPRHAAMLALLGRGELLVRNAGSTLAFRLSGGFVQVRANVVRVVAEQAEAVEAA